MIRRRDTLQPWHHLQHLQRLRDLIHMTWRSLDRAEKAAARLEGGCGYLMPEDEAMLMQERHWIMQEAEASQHRAKALRDVLRMARYERAQAIDVLRTMESYYA